jgi:hypothetical protein
MMSHLLSLWEWFFKFVKPMFPCFPKQFGVWIGFHSKFIIWFCVSPFHPTLHPTRDKNICVIELSIKSPCLWAPVCSFSGIHKIRKFLLNLNMKWWNSAFNAQGSRVSIVVVHIRLAISICSSSGRAQEPGPAPKGKETSSPIIVQAKMHCLHNVILISIPKVLWTFQSRYSKMGSKYDQRKLAPNILN